MRILIAEDERSLNEIIVKKLTSDGYSVDACFDGEEAISVLSYTDYDAVILDIMMPKADGFADDAREAFVDRVLPGQDRRPPAPLVGAEAPHRDDRLRVPGTGQALRDGPHRGEIRRLRGRVAPREGEQIPQAGVA